MDRRPVGVALVVVALAAVMVVPALSGLRSVGIAVPIALPPPPAVGDCAAALAPLPGAADRTPPVVPASGVLIGSCQGMVVGEVVAYWATQEALADAPRSRRAGPCYQPLVQYTGLPVPGAPADPLSPSTADLSWRPTIAFRAYLITPSDLELRAGRDWVACLITAGTAGYYQGSLRGAFLNDTLPTAYGSCWNTETSGRLTGPGDCFSAHTAQLLATGWSDDRGRPSADRARESCARLAGALMDTDDPTRGGQLAVVAGRMDRLTVGWSGNPSSVGCFVITTGDRRLTGLVIGLGDRPIPFVS